MIPTPRKLFYTIISSSSTQYTKWNYSHFVTSEKKNCEYSWHDTVAWVKGFSFLTTLYLHLVSSHLTRISPDDGERREILIMITVFSSSKMRMNCLSDALDVLVNIAKYHSTATSVSSQASQALSKTSKSQWFSLSAWHCCCRRSVSVAIFEFYFLEFSPQRTFHFAKCTYSWMVNDYD